MKTLMILLSAAILAGGCRDRDPSDPDYDLTSRKTVAADHDDDFVQTRTSYEVAARERLDRLSERIDQLAQRADAGSRSAVARLRVERDALSMKLARTGQQAETSWDAFETDVSRSFDRLERDLKAAVD